MRSIRVYDSELRKVIYGKKEMYDDSILIRFQHFEDESPVVMDGTGIVITEEYDGGTQKREIFDGDIFTANLYPVSESAEYVGVVVYTDGAFYVHRKVKAGSECHGVCEWETGRLLNEYVEAGNFTILGNIYEDGHILRENYQVKGRQDRDVTGESIWDQ